MNCLARRIFKAFTITEILVALAVIGVLTAALMPIIHSLVPNQNVLMAKKTFYTIESVVSGIINDTGCYPQIRQRVGFQDGKGYRKCTLWGSSKSESANDKFKTLFKDKMGASSDNFTTSDGVRWVISNVNFGSSNGNALIIVDVNGNKGPDCGQDSSSTACTDGRTKGFDKYSVEIYANGKINIKDGWVKDAVKTDAKIVGN